MAEQDEEDEEGNEDDDLYDGDDMSSHGSKSSSEDGHVLEESQKSDVDAENEDQDTIGTQGQQEGNPPLQRSSSPLNLKGA